MWIWTSDLSGAGTDADIAFQVYGLKGKSDEIRLDNKTDNFEQGQVDRFMVSIPCFKTMYTLYQQSDDEASEVIFISL